jgi:probable rRNA maturation factor
MTRRKIAIANRHPRLRFRAATLRALIECLDRNFAQSPRGARTTPRPAALRRAAAPTEAGMQNPSPGKVPSPVPAGELSLVFLTDEALAALHGTFLDDPSATDVITFPAPPGSGAAGDICVSVDRAAAEARRRGCPLTEELTLYLVHGWLHLAGHDDLAPALKRRMRAAEARALRLVRQGPGFPDFRLA